MSNENTMVVFTLESKARAEELLRRLQDLDIADEGVEIAEAAFATKVSSGHVKLKQFNDLGGGRGAFGGGTIGVIAGTIVAGPVGTVVGGVVGATVAGLYARLRDSGVNDRFMREISEKLEPGQTALFIVYRGTPGEEMLQTLRDFDASLVYTTLSDEAVAELRQTYEAESGEEVVEELDVFTAEATEADTEATEADIEPLAARGDDLTVIDGIGPKIAEALKAAGIVTFNDLHRASEVQLREVLQEARIVVPRSLPTWPRQAGMAAAGDWKELYKFNAKRKLDSAK